MSVNEITSRTIAYEKLGIHVLWIALYDDALKEEKYSPKAWEKWCHAAYFGRVYYWLSGITIVPVHFAEYKLYVEPSSWYGDGGEERTAGDYYKSSKRYKRPCIGKLLNLATDFKFISKPEWKQGTVYVPKCKICHDNLQKWW